MVAGSRFLRRREIGRVFWTTLQEIGVGGVCLGHSSFLNGDESDMFSYNFRSLGLLKSIMASFA